MTVAQSANYNINSKASWYSVKTNRGTATASGEIFSNNKMTAAHKTLPLGTIVQVTNLDNGKSVLARINDRGPYVPNRGIDLSPLAFQQIASLNQGIARVNIRVVQTK